MQGGDGYEDRGWQGDANEEGIDTSRMRDAAKSRGRSGDRNGGDASVLRKGWYPAQIRTAEDEVVSRNGRSVMLVVEFRVKGPERNHKITAWLTYRNQNPQVVQIGSKQIGQLLESVDYDGPRKLDAEMLEGRRLDVRVTIEESEDYGRQNRIGGFARLGAKAEDRDAGRGRDRDGRGEPQDDRGGRPYDRGSGGAAYEDRDPTDPTDVDDVF